jgi:hypothetical protein
MVNPPNSQVSPILPQELATVRTSKRANKATTEALKDAQKVFTLAQCPKTTAPTAGPNPAEAIASQIDAPMEDMGTTHAQDVDMANDIGTVDAPTVIEQQASPEDMSAMLDPIRGNFPEIASTIQTMIEALVSEVQALKKQLSSGPKPSSYAAVVRENVTKRKINDDLRAKLAEAVDKPTKTQILADTWSTRNNKRTCTEPQADPHLSDEPVQFEIVHMAGFDLMKDEPRATISAVLNKKFDVPLDTIINVSPMAPKLQELVIDSRRLDSLRSAIARSGGNLKLSTKLDARLPGFDTTDTKILEDSLSRFNIRVDREIQRLHQSPSRRLKDVADLLVAYKRDGTRKSAPRSRRSPIFASAFIDEAILSSAGSAMVAEQI